MVIPFSPWHFWLGTFLLAALLLAAFWHHDSRDRRRHAALLLEIKGAKALGSSAYTRHEVADRAIRDLYVKYRRHEEILAAEGGAEPEPINEVEREWRDRK